MVNPLTHKERGLTSNTRIAYEADIAGESPHLDYWRQFFKYKFVIKGLPLVINDSMVCWTGDSPGESNYYTYMPGIICPAGTPVPDGLDFRDLPQSFVAKGLYGDEVFDVIQKYKLLGYTTCYTDLGWNAKLFIGDDEIAKHENTPCRWLVPCIPVGEENPAI